MVITKNTAVGKNVKLMTKNTISGKDLMVMTKKTIAGKDVRCDGNDKDDKIAVTDVMVITNKTAVGKDVMVITIKEYITKIINKTLVFIYPFCLEYPPL